jgi:hypothetical protein
VRIVFNRRLVMIVLLMSLLGADSASATVCEGFCAVGLNGTPHQTALESLAYHHHHRAAEHHMTGCSVCPKQAGWGMLPSPHCANLAFAPREALVVVSGPRTAWRLNALSLQVFASLAQIDAGRYSNFHSPPALRNSASSIFLLRI